MNVNDKPRGLSALLAETLPSNAARLNGSNDTYDCSKLRSIAGNELISDIRANTQRN
jgi:hypothetical protein